MNSNPALRPLALRRDGDALLIEWSDGITTRSGWQELRRACPCAACGEERKRPPDPFRVLSAREIAAGPLQPVAMKPRGHYAYQIVWNDGHDTGIYSIDLLRSVGLAANAASANPPSDSSKN
ncbi:DUF971 domain-containing protein [Tuwongella immobilis]|uniref:Gamma-butyrobetaine hydroxylase-like N-terminal domain-containing protein n=1 Tax=Tuwongella immobilis TaxID=692036 RepID=A0A6C2YPV2_9BACT|nr:DUF971 domain-containing protein [Tuwongella immobilis]VIP03209.1 Marine sediment metagenome DNA, contig: S01H1_L01765 OS=marine sediment metagenome GN=S01H1_06955 PE=4 SV=1: DUF971 [Tuwongella immobilis]VTS03715.1 Marine sediment metagenome DNA, contig: S01H1_L01765 OS=marine sediment metagenome GN=S01H1_06955 PE=4 SV=1: DUF971 [Tuwongella immobilis]